MSSLFFTLSVAFVVAVAGWVAGIVGYVRASAVQRELADLSRKLRAIQAGMAAPAPPPPVAEARPRPVEGIPPAAAAYHEPQPAIWPSMPAMPRIEEATAARWGTWLGALALLFAGGFLVRYAADNGLLGPGTRCTAAALLGCALLAAAEFFDRPAGAGLLRDRVPSGIPIDQGPAALTAGGIATLFAAAYGAGPLYGLVGPGVAFVLLAAVGVAGLALSLRRGPLVAAVGVACAFGTPALVSTADPSVAGLFAYLAVVTAVSLGIMRRTAWTWLGWTAVAAGAAWVAASASVGDAWPPSLFVPVAAALYAFLLPPEALNHPVGKRLAWVPFTVLGFAGLSLAVLTRDHAAGLGVLLLSPIAVARAVTDERQDRLPWIAATLGCLALLAGGPMPETALIASAGALALFHGACGHLMQRRAVHPIRWAALPAAVPLAAMILAHAGLPGAIEPGWWASVAVALAAWLVGATALTIRAADGDGTAARRVGGVHAAGACAALAFACAVLLTGEWLTLAISLFLPPLAVIAVEVKLPALRRVAMVTAAVVLVRSLGDRWIPASLVDGPSAATLLITYGAPTVAFAWSAMRFRRKADDAAVALLESGAWALGTALMVLELRKLSTMLHPGEHSMVGQALDAAGFAVLATAARLTDARRSRMVTGWAWRVEGAIALCLGALLILANPGFTGRAVGGVPILDGLLAGYLVPAALAAWACRSRPAVDRRTGDVLAGYAGLAAWVWMTLEVRRLSHGDDVGLWSSPFLGGESWAISGAWLAYGAGLMAAGIVLASQRLRIMALSVLTVASAKVFLLDMAGLDGLWRVASFLGLGLSLIAIGSMHARFVARRDGSAQGQDGKG